MKVEDLRTSCMDIYEELFGGINIDAGHSLNTILCKRGGVLVIKSYSSVRTYKRELDRVLFALDGKIYRDKKMVGRHGLQLPEGKEKSILENVK